MQMQKKLPIAYTTIANWQGDLNAPWPSF